MSDQCLIRIFFNHRFGELDITKEPQLNREQSGFHLEGVSTVDKTSIIGRQEVSYPFAVDTFSRPFSRLAVQAYFTDLPRQGRLVYRGPLGAVPIQLAQNGLYSDLFKNREMSL